MGLVNVNAMQSNGPQAKVRLVACPSLPPSRTLILTKPTVVQQSIFASLGTHFIERGSLTFI